MKRIRIIFILLLVAVIFIFKTNVYAASCSLSVSSTSVYVGDTFTVTAKVNAAAAWNVHVTASGPVSGCVINQADASSDETPTPVVRCASSQIHKSKSGRRYVRCAVSITPID